MYKQIAAKKRALRDENLIKEWLIPEDKLPKDNDVLEFPVKSGYLTPEEIEITESSVPELFAKIKSKEWSALKIIKAFSHRSQIAHQLTNCLSEIFYEQGFKDAEALDKYYEETGKLKGLFHGIPISLKDNINVKGQATTIGMVDYCFKPEKFDYDSSIAEILRDQGAVFYVKTNVPVAMMTPETDNHVYGVTTNPFNRKLSSGGSSGGAAAHAALKGSCVEIGSDIGGSIRIPASFQNLYSLRPTFGRYPTYGTRSGLPGLESVNSVNGPLCTNLDSMKFYLENLANSDPSQYDPKVSFQPWKKLDLDTKKLTFAYCLDDGYVKPTPPITRGVKTVIEALKKQGHEVIEWDPAEHLRLARLIGKFFVADGGKHVLKVTKATGEPLFPYMAEYGTTPESGVSELWDLQSERTTLAKKFLDRWVATKKVTKTGKPIDALILPVTPFAGNPIDKFGDYVGYTSVFNALDVSVATLPVSRVDKTVDLKDETFEPRNESEKYIWSNYDPEESHGGAITVQIACRKQEDEKVVALAEYISKLL